MEIKPIIRKITITGDNFSVSFKEDQTEYAKDLIEAGCNGLDETNIEDYFMPGMFAEEDIESLNGQHFLYGYLESLYQSDRCPDILHTCTCPLYFTVEKIGNEEENKRKTVFFITVFEKLEENPTENQVEKKIHPYVFGTQETVGCFPDIERCRDILINNICDIYDNAGFEFAIIEEFDFDAIYPAKKSIEVYKAKHYTLDTPVPDGKGGILKMVPKHKVTYEKIDFPEGDKCYKHLKDQPFALY